MKDDIIGERVMINRRTGEIVQSLGPMYAEDWPYQDLPDDHPLLRYMDLWKFEDMLRTGTLYFRRADKFEDDPLEGTISREGVHQTSRTDQAMKERIQLAPQTYAEMAAYRDIAKSVTFVNCWHINNEECPKMWDAYTTSSESILVISSAGRLKLALEQPVMMSTVKYVDQTAPRTEFDERSLFFYKESSFAFEKEYRLIVDLYSLEGANGSIDPKNPNDFSRKLGINVGTLVYALQPHPGASDEVKEKIAALVAEFLPQMIPVQPENHEEG
jgi:hypothetical protein